MTFDPNAIVQIILISPNGTHQDTVHAGALASVLALRSQREQKASARIIQNWVKDGAHKLVTWMHNLYLYQLAQELGLEHDLVHTEHGSALALGPMRYADLPKKVIHAHTSNSEQTDIELPRDIDQWCVQDDDEPAHPMIMLNQNISMSTNKSTAQAAQALTQAWLCMDADTEQNWFDQGCALTFAEASGPWMQRFEDLDTISMDVTFVHENDLAQIPSDALTAMAIYPTMMGQLT